MFLLDWLFGRHHDKPRAEPAHSAPESGPCAPGTSIRYSSDLIEHLVRDHRSMLDCFGQIGSAARSGRLDEVVPLLERFRADLHGHLLVENVRLYVYLEHALANDPASHALMHGFRHDMDEIGKKVVAFLTRYARLGEDPSLAASFVADLDAVGAALVDRIRREEEVLYPLYAPVA
ncbi:hemerythrin domain-containing protein [Thauera sp.]|uniref:hemerythrin domain-containing protein n=1 Tax=Thauera sp. TaxID=1905334 RepID=UPI0039E6CDBC